MRAYDPEAMEKAKSVLPNITYCSNPYEAAEGADAIVIVTEWDEFRQVDWNRLLSIVEQPLVVDGRNVFGPEISAARDSGMSASDGSMCPLASLLTPARVPHCRCQRTMLTKSQLIPASRTQ